MKTSRWLRNALAGAAGLALVVGAIGAVGPVGAADPGSVSSQTVATSATKALDWLLTQFAANGHHLKSGFVDGEGEFQTFDDTGLTIDALLALAAAGRDGDAESQEGENWVAANVSEYVTGFDPNSLYAGALGKAIVFAVIYDRDVNAIDGRDLEADLRGRLQSNGRFTDKATDFESGEPADYSNGVGQALAVLALAALGDGAPDQSVDYLLLQQCPNGGFRIELGDTQCADNAKVDHDATTFALTALATVDHDAAGAAIFDGLTYLFNTQSANGSFKDNANSSGLGAVTMRGFGDHPRANKGAAFVKTLQLSAGNDAGAILVDKAGYDAAVADGLDEQGRTVAARATAQAVLALGLPAYPLIGEREPVEPSTTLSLSAASVPEGGTLTATGGGFASTEKVRVVVSSDPVTVGEPAANASGVISQSFTLPASVTAGAHTVTLTGLTSGVTIAAPFTVTAAQTTTPTTAGTTPTTAAATIVRTGADSATDQAAFAAVLLGVGGALLLSTRRRRIVYPFQK